MLDLVYPSEPAPVLPLPTADRPVPPDLKGQEVLPVVRESGEVYARASRAYCHGGSFLLHPVVHLHILNRFDELYLQKRSMKKDLLPGRWDTAVGGHVSYGEYITEALFRESGEELGFHDYNPVWLDSYVFRSRTESELVNIFAAVGNFTPHPDMDEVSEGRYWSMKEIEDCLGKSVFTPNFEGEFKRIRKILEALL
jgi:isopentenyldiphosphate isomerase